MNDVIAWCVYDRETRELVIVCQSRDEARKIAKESGARYARAVVA